MFSLIISIIAIALVVILAGASLYYGGDAFNKGGAKGQAAQFANESQQLSAAVTMFKSDNGGSAPTDATAELVAGTVSNGMVPYLKSIPPKWTVEDNGSAASKSVASKEVCNAMLTQGQAIKTTAALDVPVTKTICDAQTDPTAYFVGL